MTQEVNNQNEGPKSKKEKQSSLNRAKSISFMITSILGVLTSLISAGILKSITNLAFLEEVKFPSLPLVAWIGISASIYCLIGFVLNLSIKNKGLFHRIFRIPIWSELRNFGDQNIARVSYLGLILIPVTAYFYNQNINGFILADHFTFPENIKLIYFASWSFSIALFTYSIGCPKLIRKERKLDKARNVNLILNSVTDTNVLIEDEKVEHPELDIENVLIRTLSFLFYLVGIALTIVVLFRGASIVYNV